MPVSAFGNLARQIARSAFVTDAELHRAVEQGLALLIEEAAHACDLTPERLARVYDIAAEFEFAPDAVTRLAARRRGGPDRAVPEGDDAAAARWRVTLRGWPSLFRRKLFAARR